MSDSLPLSDAPLSNALPEKPPAPDTRDRIRMLFARLLNDVSSPEPTPQPRGSSRSGDLFSDDPFGADPFDTDPFETTLYADPDSAAGLHGDGFSRLGESGDGLSASFGSDSLRLSLGERTEDALGWGDLQEGADDLGDTSEDSIFADPLLMQDLLRESVEEEGSPNVEVAPAVVAEIEAVAEHEAVEPIASAVPDEPAVFAIPAPGSRSTLGALPDLPPTGTHRVVSLKLEQMDALNDVLQNGWRIVQMLPSGEPFGFVVALRYAGYSA